jgi:acetylxylan esterase
MKTIMNKLVLAAICFTTLLCGLAAVPTLAASLTEVTNFGTNPSNLRMHLYVPDRLPNNAPILVASHYCTGTGPALYSGTQFAALADRYGYIVIYPSATRSGQCFDVSSSQALSRNGGSDPMGIMSMINYVQRNYNVDSTRIFATGVSSGAMMTNVLLGVYPDVFNAGAAFAGVPFGCFATTDGSLWNNACANGAVTKTAQEWGNLVRNAYPGYGGTRPRMQLWHGTSDETLRYPNFNEAIKQWTNVHSLSQTPVLTDTPQSGATRTRYGSSGPNAQVEAISLQGVAHNLPVNAAEAIRFFGLDTTPGTSSAASQPRSSLAANSSRSASSAGTPLTNTIEVRMLGVAGTESVSLQVGGTTVRTWTPTTTMTSYTATTNASGEIRVAYTNDATGRDVRVDYIVVNGATRQAENQQTNTGSYSGTCGGGSFSEWMYCTGYISFGTLSGPVNASSTPTNLSSAAAASSIPMIASSRPAASSSRTVNSSSSAATTCQQCNWYGTRYPLCITTQSGWGWENQRSCISRTTCSAQPSPYGIVASATCP